jgi:hypothetical protein
MDSLLTPDVGIINPQSNKASVHIPSNKCHKKMDSSTEMPDDIYV